MKKVFMMVLASMIIGVAQANVVLTEHFDREAGQLSSGSMSDMGTNTTNWFTYVAGTKNYLQVIDPSLTYAGYQTAANGKAVSFSGNGYTDMRALSSEVKLNNAGDKIYMAFLLNATTVKATADYFIAMNKYDAANSTAGNQVMRVYMLKDGDNGFKLGVAKCTESSNALYMNYSGTLATGVTHLVVVEYEKIAGDNNDSIRLYINPTKTEPGTPILTTYSAINANGIEQGSKKAADAEDFYNVTLRPSTNTATMLLDEIRVATGWGELFETGGGVTTDPALGINPSTINFQDCYTGEPKSQVISVTAENLTEGVTISHTNSEVTLSATSLTQAQAEAGYDLTMTLTPTVAGLGADTIVLTSSGVEKKVTIAWGTTAVSEYATIAALKAGISDAEEYSAWVRLTGEAIVTRDTTISGVHELYLQDSTGAMKIEDAYDVWTGHVRLGDKISGWRGLNTSASFGVLPVMPMNLPTVVSSSNEVVAQEVTLSELQAHAADYLLEVVTIKDVTFANAGETFSGNTASYGFTQGSESASLRVEMGRGLSGKTIPEKAHVTGFSLNTQGTVIVPRGYNDVVDATPQPLLVDGGFEEYTIGSFMGMPKVEYTHWTGLNAMGLTTESVDILEGANALKTTSDFKTTGVLQQDIDLSAYNTDDEFKMRICYKVLTDQGAGTLTLDSYWSHPTQGRMNNDAALLAGVQLANSTEWDTIEVVTKKPLGANKFCFRLSIVKNAIVLLDNFAFEYVEPTEYFSVSPERISSFQCNVGETITVGTFTVRQKGLTQPVTLEITGDGAAMYSIDKTQLTTDGETVTVTYHPTATGAHNAALLFVDDESQASTLCNTAIMLYGVAIDPTQKPTITLNPTSLEHFTCAAGERVTDTVEVSSSNCIYNIYGHVTHIEGDAFSVGDGILLKNTTTKTVVTFYPLVAGEYSARLYWTTEGGDTVDIYVSGTATEGAPAVVDYDTEMTWDISNPLDMLNEGFDDAATYRNKTYQLGAKGWQNVVSQGTRAWWGYNTDTTSIAKICAYATGESESSKTPMEVWLITPALNFNTTGSKQFSFRVMGELMTETQDGYLQVWYIDPVGGVQQKIDDVDAMIPFGDSERSGEWVPVVIDFTGQNLADAFYMAFRFAGYRHNNAPIYNVDEVTWGIQKIATDAESAEAEVYKNTRLEVRDGQVVIIRGGEVYDLTGRRID